MKLFHKLRERWRVVAVMLMAFDFLAVVFSYFMALWVRFDCSMSAIFPYYLSGYRTSIFVYAAAVVAINFVFKMYRSVWRYAGYTELMRCILSAVLSCALYKLCMHFYQHMPISYHLGGAVLQLGFSVLSRFSYRFLLLLIGRNDTAEKTAVNVMLIGAGEAGQMIARDIKNAREINEKVRCFIDDDPNKWNREIDGAPIFGGRDRIMEACQKFGIQKIYLTMPSADKQDKRDILNICNETGCELKSLPGLYQLYTGEVTVSQMRNVNVEDLLGREPIKADMDQVFRYVRGKSVLVTGVGSIGSELSRQIAAHEPKHLILFDIYENNAYDIQQELKKKYPDLKLTVLIGSVRDSRKMFDVFDKYRPQIVFHAAAHKHVPLMEDSPCEAIKNNALGTYKTAYAAMAHGCERFVLISTDKAVNPTNVMGATKRLCEMIVQAFDAKVKAGEADRIPQLFTHGMRDLINPPELNDALRKAKTEFVAVRFGNVLGSNGSVIPLFKKQIEAGGPVTVTHPDIIRYFMTIPEAVSLVLLAGTHARGGEIFVLDMGQPVKIDQLARNMIRLSGYKPDVDIKIVYTGLRPGEKLYEEKLMAEEGLKKTQNDLIHIGCPIPFDIDVFLTQLDDLMEAAYRNKDDIRDRLRAVVSTYHPAQ